MCPRHPQHVAYVRCQRCERPVCPACQVPSAVGVRCVDCAHQAKAARRPSRTVLGGAPVDGAAGTLGFVGLCVVVFLLQQLPGLSLTGRLAFNPALAASEPWRFLTTALLHASPAHLALNMFALWIVGGQLEQVLGRWRYLTVLVLSALGGSTMVYVLASPGSQSWTTWTVGASGAVFGLFATQFMVQRRFGRDTSAVLVLLGLNLAVSFVGPGALFAGWLSPGLTSTPSPPCARWGRRLASHHPQWITRV